MPVYRREEMTDRYCDSCKALVFDWGPIHVCPPIFEVEYINEEKNTSERHLLHAINYREAAEKWAEIHDRFFALSKVSSGKEVKEISVRLKGDKEWVQYFVRGQMVPKYEASRDEFSEEMI
jgi:hypothetical protein